MLSQRQDLASVKQRLKAPEAKAALGGILLTEAPRCKKAKADIEAQGEFESECPGCCGTQDALYVGAFN